MDTRVVFAVLTLFEGKVTGAVFTESCSAERGTPSSSCSSAYARCFSPTARGGGTCSAYVADDEFDQAGCIGRLARRGVVDGWVVLAE